MHLEGENNEERKENILELWASIKRENIWVIEAKEGLENTKEIKRLFKEIITKNSPNPKDTNTQI
jgi:hypothetical protein